MGLLSLGLNINAQEQKKNEQEDILGVVLTKERICKEETLKMETDI